MEEYRRRTTKQPLSWQCNNPECSVDGALYRFQADIPKCPKCSMEGFPYILMLALIHYMLPDPKGVFLGSRGRYDLACQKSRTYLSLPDNNEAATGDPSVVNCPGCLKRISELRVRGVSGGPIEPE